jgi:small conductance mechanosensitive channel
MPETMNQVGATLAVLRSTFVDIAVRYGLQILSALILLFVGLRVAAHAGKVLDAWLTKKALDVSLRDLVVRIFKILIIGATAVMAAEKAGVPVTSLIAGVGVAGLGVGLALQGVLGNVFAGLTILFTRPFKVGEFIELLGIHGQVITITVFSTTLLHADQSRVVIPNRKIVGEVLHNYGTTRQLDLRVAVAYATDLEVALSVARATLEADPRVLAEPAPLVGVKELSESAIILSLRPWVAVADYEKARVDLYRALVEAYRRSAVELPFPQREIRILGAPAAGTSGAAAG